jgi:hypothetical protein
MHEALSLIPAPKRKDKKKKERKKERTAGTREVVKVEGTATQMTEDIST